MSGPWLMAACNVDPGPSPARSRLRGSILGPYIYVFYASFLVAFLFTPIMRMVAIVLRHHRPARPRPEDAPPAGRLPGRHGRLSRAGCAGWRSASSCTLHRKDLGWHDDHPVVKFSIVLGAMIIIVLGLWDDIYGLKPRVKIAGQVVGGDVPAGGRRRHRMHPVVSAAGDCPHLSLFHRRRAVRLQCDAGLV